MNIRKMALNIILTVAILILGMPVCASAEEFAADKVIMESAEEETENTVRPQSELGLTASYPSVIKCKEEITFTMNASGGTGNYKYRVYNLEMTDPSGRVTVYDTTFNYTNLQFKDSNLFKITFHVPGTYYIRFTVMDMGTNLTANTPVYTLNIQDERYPSVEQIINEVAAECEKNCSTDFEKAVWLHDWILDHAEYDYSLSFCAAEGVLARGKGTCESYHRAYEMLLNKVGVQTGRTISSSHVWTAVRMDGEWYQVDCTWDDTGQQRYLYFGLTDELIGLAGDAHKIYKYTPGCESTSLENNYFIKTGKIKQWSDPFVSIIKQNIADGKREFAVPAPQDGMLVSYEREIIYRLAAYQLTKQIWDGVEISASYSVTDDTIIVKAEDTVNEFVNELQSLSVVPPSKVIYQKGEKADTSGLTVTAVYASGLKVLSESEYQIEGFDTETVGDRTATIVYGGKSITFTYTVQEKQEEPKEVSVSYRTHVQDIGWQGWKVNGAMSGTSGKAKRLEGIQIKLSTAAELGIQYTTHCQDYGWLPWSSNGGMSGTTGEAKRLEAIKIQLTEADKEKYDVYYRVHAETYGWMGWVKNGVAAGTSGYGKRLEGIQIVIVTKGGSFDRNMKGISSRTSKGFIAKTGKEPSVSGAGNSNTMYRTHVQDIGWQGWKYNGQMSGTSGKAKRLEGIELKLTNQQYSGGIQYRTHIQDIGWQGWKTNGGMSGTSGRAKRLEAIQIKLTGTMAQKYDVYYRVHAQSIGWMGWAKNGSSAGTAGYGYRLEGIEIRLVAKGTKAPGSTANSFRSPSSIEAKINEIRTYTYVPYISGGTTPRGWDCSGFTMWALKYMGVNIPRLSHEQAVKGTPVNKNDMSKWKPGDILVYSSGGYAGHVALYLGGGKLMHALNYKWGTLIQDVNYYEMWDSGTTLTGVRRYL